MRMNVSDFDFVLFSGVGSLLSVFFSLPFDDHDHHHFSLEMILSVLFCKKNNVLKNERSVLFQSNALFMTASLPPVLLLLSLSNLRDSKQLHEITQ
jgi:hypothetical protein